MRKYKAHQLEGQNDGSAKFGSDTKELEERDGDRTKTKDVWLMHWYKGRFPCLGILGLVAECAFL